MTRSAFLPFALPDIDEAEIQSVAEALRSGWITTGPKTKQFEAEFAAYVGAKHAIAVNSCTAAMHLALEAIGIGEDDEVITTTYTFAATAEVIRYFKAKPVLVDVDRETLNIDTAKIEAAITPRTKAIIPVHVAGLACDLDAVLDIAKRHNLRVIEDAAHSLPTRYKGKLIGALSDFACFSFYATKALTTGEGGMICTDNDDWADRCRIMSLHGISRDAWKRYTAEGTWYYEIIAPGFKYNLTDVASALGLVQLSKLDAMWKRRTEIAMRFNEAFADMPELQVPPVGGSGDQHAWHLYLLRLNTSRLSIGRNEFVERLRTQNIGVSVHFIPLHMHPYYRDTFNYAPGDLPVAAAEFEREISLPIYSRMSDADVDSVIESVRSIVRDTAK
jgi:perosamine synthetase